MKKSPVMAGFDSSIKLDCTKTRSATLGHTTTIVADIFNNHPADFDSITMSCSDVDMFTGFQLERHFGAEKLFESINSPCTTIYRLVSRRRE